MDLNQFPEVAVIIPCRNVAGVVSRCLGGVLAQDYPPEKIRIIAIDDGSTDSTATIIAGFGDRIKLLRHESNRGLAAARNSGIKATDAEFLAFLDSDMVVRPDWLKVLLPEFADSTVIGVIGDSQLPSESTTNRLDRYFYSNWRGARKTDADRPIDFRYFLFHNTIVRRTALVQAGLFDETITTYGGEDTDLAIRLYRIYPRGLHYSSTAVAEHYHQRSVAEFCRAMENYGHDNLPRLLERYPEFKNELAGGWIDSIKGYLAFNCVVRLLVRSITAVMPLPVFIRYLVVESVIRGARQASRP
ncbi:MAG: glycosyltransferase [Candidatus Neomarinimicrobiota bacterium]